MKNIKNMPEKTKNWHKKSGLIIKKDWLNKIFADKSWEIRGNNTTKRGKIYLIESGSGEIKGECILTDSIYLTEEEYKNTERKHKIDTEKHPYPYKRVYAWELKEVKKYDEPIPYKHKQGAVIWVDLTN